jgi:hypothetical protein
MLVSVLGLAGCVGPIVIIERGRSLDVDASPPVLPQLFQRQNPSPATPRRTP